jgi:hypothetical protein
MEGESVFYNRRYYAYYLSYSNSQLQSTLFLFGGVRVDGAVPF